MKSRDIAGLAFKIIGVIVLVQSIQLASSLIGLFCLPEPLRPENYYFIIIPGSQLIIGLILILISNKLAGLICKENKTIDISYTAGELQAIAFSCIGLWLICVSLSSFIFNITNYLKAPHSSVITWQRGKLLYETIRLLIGIILFIQSRGLVALWDRLTRLRNPVHKD